MVETQNRIAGLDQKPGSPPTRSVSEAHPRSRVGLVSPAPTPPGSNGRQADGRFARGNAGGPGNPFARQCAALRKLVHEVVSKEDMAEILIALRERAKQGDAACAKLIFQYAMGQPTPFASPDDLNRQECEQYKSDTQAAQHLGPAIEGSANLAGALPVFREMARQIAAQTYVKTHVKAVTPELDQVDAETWAKTPIDDVPQLLRRERRRLARRQRRANGKTSRKRQRRPARNEIASRVSVRAGSVSAARGQGAPMTNGSNGARAVVEVPPGEKGVRGR